MLDAKLFGINPDYFSYTLSKSACHTLTQIAAQAMRRLRVNGIAPELCASVARQKKNFNYHTNVIFWDKAR